MKTIVRLSGRRDGKSHETLLDFHLCTEEDFVDWPPPTVDSKRMLDKILKDPKRGLYCIDWEKYGEIVKIWGIS